MCVKISNLHLSRERVGEEGRESEVGGEDRERARATSERERERERESESERERERERERLESKHELMSYA